MAPRDFERDVAAALDRVVPHHVAVDADGRGETWVWSVLAKLGFGESPDQHRLLATLALLRS